MQGIQGSWREWATSRQSRLSHKKKLTRKNKTARRPEKKTSGELRLPRKLLLLIPVGTRVGMGITGANGLGPSAVLLDGFWD